MIQRTLILYTHKLKFLLFHFSCKCKQKNKTESAFCSHMLDDNCLVEQTAKHRNRQNTETQHINDFSSHHQHTVRDKTERFFHDNNRKDKFFANLFSPQL